jgi:hypothetical protein
MKKYAGQFNTLSVSEPSVILYRNNGYADEAKCHYHFYVHRAYAQRG